MTPRAQEPWKVEVFPGQHVVSHAVPGAYDNFGPYWSYISYFLVFERTWGASASATIGLEIRIPAPVRQL